MVRQKPAKLPFPSSNLGATLSVLNIMLYLVATPIGNLADITFRAIEILKNCDYILCEDTRHSRVLLKHYEIKTPLKSFHKFNEASKEDAIIQDLKAEKNIALISDAGTPGISDPGQRLVQRCVLENIQVVAIPGPCAAIAALSCSGLRTDRFQFLGFLPKQKKTLQQALQEILFYPGTTICYESPLRLPHALEILKKLAPHGHVAVARELTKKFEEIIRGKPDDLLNYFTAHPLKGEIVLLIEGIENKDEKEWSLLSVEEHVSFLQHHFGLTRMEAIKLAAKQRGVPKRTIYSQVVST